MENIEQVLDSREVAEMVEKNHNELLKDIRRYCKQLSLGKIPQSDFFTESTYKTDRGKEYPCYNVTKKGCEFIAHKLTGTKGTIFTARYINRFHEMKDVISDKAAVQQAGNAELVQIQETIKQQGKMLESINRKLSASMVPGLGSSNGQDRYRGEIVRIIESMHDEKALCKVYTFAKYVPQQS